MLRLKEIGVQKQSKPSTWLIGYDPIHDEGNDNDGEVYM
jgi:hypothetical protein